MSILIGQATDTNYYASIDGTMYVRLIFNDPGYSVDYANWSPSPNMPSGFSGSAGTFTGSDVFTAGISRVYAFDGTALGSLTGLDLTGTTVESGGTVALSLNEDGSATFRDLEGTNNSTPENNFDDTFKLPTSGWTTQANSLSQNVLKLIFDPTEAGAVATATGGTVTYQATGQFFQVYELAGATDAGGNTLTDGKYIVYPEGASSFKVIAADVSDSGFLKIPSSGQPVALSGTSASQIDGSPDGYVYGPPPQALSGGFDVDSTTAGEFAVTLPEGVSDTDHVVVYVKGPGGVVYTNWTGQDTGAAVTSGSVGPISFSSLLKVGDTTQNFGSVSVASTDTGWTMLVLVDEDGDGKIDTAENYLSKGLTWTNGTPANASTLTATVGSGSFDTASYTDTGNNNDNNNNNNNNIGIVYDADYALSIEAGVLKVGKASAGEGDLDTVTAGDKVIAAIAAGGKIYFSSSAALTGGETQATIPLSSFLDADDIPLPTPTGGGTWELIAWVNKDSDWLIDAGESVRLGKLTFNATAPADLDAIETVTSPTATLTTPTNATADFSSFLDKSSGSVASETGGLGIKADGEGVKVTFPTDAIGGKDVIVTVRDAYGSTYDGSFATAANETEKILDLNAILGLDASTKSPLQIFAALDSNGDTDHDIGEAYVSASVAINDAGQATVTQGWWVDHNASTQFLSPVTLTFTEPTSEALDNNHSTTDFVVPESINFSAMMPDISEPELSGVFKIFRAGDSSPVFSQAVSSDGGTVTGNLAKLPSGLSELYAVVEFENGIQTARTDVAEVRVFRGKPEVLSIDWVATDENGNAPTGDDQFYKVSFNRAVLDLDSSDFDVDGGYIDAVTGVDEYGNGFYSTYLLKISSNGKHDIEVSLRDGTPVVDGGKTFYAPWTFSAISMGNENLTFTSKYAGTFDVNVYVADPGTTSVANFTVAVAADNGTATVSFANTGEDTNGWVPTSDTTYYFEIEGFPTNQNFSNYEFSGNWLDISATNVATLYKSTVQVIYDTTHGWVYNNDNGVASEWAIDKGSEYVLVGDSVIEQTRFIYEGVFDLLTNASDFVPPQEDRASFFYGLEGRTSDPGLDSLVVVDPTDNIDEYMGVNGPGGIDTLDLSALRTYTSVVNLVHNFVSTHTSDQIAGPTYTIGLFDRVVVGGEGNTILGTDGASETFVILDDTRGGDGNLIIGGESAYVSQGGSTAGEIVNLYVNTPANGPITLELDIQGPLSRWISNSDAYKGISVSNGNNSATVVGLERLPVSWEAPVGSSRLRLTLEDNAATKLGSFTPEGLTVELGPNNVFLKAAETDIVDYSALSAGVRAYLGEDGKDKNAGVDGGDILVDIEGIVGTDYSDALLGNDESNLLVGGGGDDRMAGGEGADVLWGGTGFDLLTGGAGNDFLVDLDGGGLLSGGAASLSGVTFSTEATKDVLTITTTAASDLEGLEVGDFVVVSGTFGATFGGLSSADITRSPYEVVTVDGNVITVKMSATATETATFGTSLGEAGYLTVPSRELGEMDVFVVGGGSFADSPRATITDFQFSGNNAGLTGRALEFSSDKIGLNLAAMLNATNVAAIAAYADSNSIDFSDAAAQWIRDNVVVTATALANGDLEVKASSRTGVAVDQRDDGNDPPVVETTSTYASVVIQGGAAQLAANQQDASVVRLDDVAGMEWQAAMGLTYSSLDVDYVIDALSFDADTLLNTTVFFSLEATAKGTVRDGKDVDGGTMQGHLTQQPAIFNPGYGDQRMIGQGGDDTYELITQDFSSLPNASASNAGRDRIFDLGGDGDTLKFSDATINDIHVKAVATGREVDANTLRFDYHQQSDSAMNEGTVYWQGHYQGTNRFALEQIDLSDGGNAREIYEVGRDINDGIRAIGVDLDGSTDGAIMVGQGQSDTFHIIWDGAVSQKVYLWGYDQSDTIIRSDDATTASRGNAAWTKAATTSSGADVTFTGDSTGILLDIILMDGGSIDPTIFTTSP